MPRLAVFYKISVSVAMVVALTSLLSACGGKFNAGSQASEMRPPATSDPMTAGDQRRWDSETSKDPSKDTSKNTPILETKTERESFLQDVTEQRPTYSEEQLVKDAEELFARRESKTEKENDKKPATTKSKAKLEPKSSATSSEDLCAGIDVTSTNGGLDLSALYNEDTKLPSSMPSSELENAKSQSRKNKFVCILLPIAIRMNEEVFRQRMEVLRLQAKQKKGIRLTEEDALWLTDIKNAYSLTPQSSFEEVLKRTDIIPLPLLLAQAALESGWGTSPATRELKNLFGMHAIKGQACKIGFDTNKACVREFTSIGQGVSAYIRLLNGGNYYSKFRDRRAQMRASKQALDSLMLLEVLGNYNETPVKYLQNVREIMTKSNKLTQFVFKEEEVDTD